MAGRPNPLLTEDYGAWTPSVDDAVVLADRLAHDPHMDDPTLAYAAEHELARALTRMRLVGS